MASATTKILLGQAIWAGSQALITIALARNGFMELLGLYYLGLGVFAPACLLVGLNLRNLIAVDADRQISILPALLIRFMAASFAVLPTGAALFLFADTQNATVALILVAGRAADQIAELAVGFYQRENLHPKIGRSAMWRGMAAALPLVLVLYFSQSILIASLVSTLFTFVALWVVDIRELRRRAAQDDRQTIRQTLALLSGTFQSAPYPLLDSLFSNLLRYSVALFLPAQTLGLIAVAQTLYAPLQLVISSLGYTFLTRARTISITLGQAHLKRHMLRGFYYSGALSSAFLGFSILVPDGWLGTLFSTDPTQTKRTVQLVSLSMFFLPFCGFAALTAYSQNKYLIPTRAVLFSMIFFVATIALLNVLSSTLSLEKIVAVFIVSVVLRLLISTRGVLM